MILRELFARLGMTVDPTGFTELNSLLELAGKAFGVLQATGGAALGFIQSAVTDTAKRADGMGDFAAKVGISTQSLQELAHVAQMSGTSVEPLAKAMGRIRRLTGDAVAGNKGASAAFRALGVDILDASGKALPAEVVFARVVDRLKAVPNEAERASLGFDVLGNNVAELTGVIQQGGAGIESLRADARALGLVMDDSLIEASGGLNDRLDQLDGVVKSVRATIASGLIPVVRDVLGRMVEWWKANKALLQQPLAKFFTGVADVAGDAALGLLEMVEGTLKLVEAMGGLDRILAVLRLTILVLLGTALYQLAAMLPGLVAGLMASGVAFNFATLQATLFNAAVAVLPLVIGALITAVALLAEDLDVFLTGGDSAIGDFIASWSGAGGALGFFADRLKELPGVLDAYFGKAKGIEDRIKRIAVGLLVLLGNAILAVGRMLADELGNLVNVLVDKLLGLLPKSWAAGLATMYADFKGFLADVGVISSSEAQKQRQAAQKMLDGLGGVKGQVITIPGAGEILNGSKGLQAANKAVANGAAGTIAAPKGGGGPVDNSVKIGEVVVNVAGTTNMTPEEMRAATAKGVDDSTKAFRRLQNANVGARE